MVHEPRPIVLVTLRQQEPDVAVPLELDSPAKWSDEQYAWFSMPPDTGGTDAYCRKLFTSEVKKWKKMCRHEPKVRERKELVERCLSNGYCWSFRRSAGQGAIIALTYGLVAASFAELTGGFIYSDDCAWDGGLFPALAEEFDRWYFRPNHALNASEDRQWAEQCVASLREGWAG